MADALSTNKSYSPPLKGLNTRYAIPVISEQQAAVLTNFQVNSSGLLETYPGYVLDGSPFPANPDSWIRSTFNFKRGTSIDWLLLAAQDDGNANATYKVDIKFTAGDGLYFYIPHNIGTAAFTSGGTAVVGTLTSWATELKAGDKIKLDSDPDSDYTEIASVNSNISITLVGGGYLGTTHAAAAYDARKIWNSAYIPRFCNFNDYAIITNGVDQPQAYNGTSLNNIVNTYSGTTQTASGSTMPTARYAISHKSRLFFANTLSFPSRLFWTHSADQTTMDPASFVDVAPQEGGQIVSITSFANSIVALKSNGRAYQVIGNFDDSTAGTSAAIIRLDYSEYIGIIAEQSAIVHNDCLYFMAQNGIYKIDKYYMRIQKTSWIVDPEIQNFNFQLIPSVSKSFPFADKAEWDSGIHTGTFAPSAGTLNTFFDDFRQTDAVQKQNYCSIAIGTDNVVHVAYVPTGSSNAKITYARYAADGTLVKEDTGISLPGGISMYGVSIGVSPVDQTVGIVFTRTDYLTSFVERSPDTGGGTVLGTWGAQVNMSSGSTVPISNYNVYSVSLVYTNGGTPFVGAMGSGSGNFEAVFAFRTSGQWQTTNPTSGATSEPQEGYQVSLNLDSTNNPYLSFVVGDNKIFAYKSTNGGATWSLIENWSEPSINPGYQTTYQGSIDHAGNYYTTYSRNGALIIKRNHTGGTSTTLDTVADSLCRGYITIYQNYQGVAPTAVLVTPINVDYYLNVAGTGTAQVERYAFEQHLTTTNFLTNPTANVISKGTDTPSTTLRPGMDPMKNNGQTICNIGFGTNANEIVIRRITFYGYWTSPQNTDSSLSAWGNYVVTGSTPNGGTLSYQLALASGGIASSFSNIVPPVLISSNATLNIAAARVFWTIGAWGGASVASIVLNYTGGGVGPTQIFGTEFFNELYWAASQIGQVSNNIVLESDISDSFLEVTYPVTTLANYKTFLYGGSSLQGDLYKLKNGYLFQGVPYACDYQSREDFLGSPIHEKDLYKVYVLYEVQSAGTFTFSYRLDNYATPGGAAWFTKVIDQTVDGFFDVDIKKSHVRSIQYRVQSTANGFATKIIGFVLVYGLNHLR